MAIDSDFRLDSLYIFGDLLIRSQPTEFYFDAWSSKITITKSVGSATTAIVDSSDYEPDAIVAVNYNRVSLQQPVDSLPGFEIVLDNLELNDPQDLVYYLNDKLYVYWTFETDIEDFQIPVVATGETVELEIIAKPECLVWYGSTKIKLRRYAENSLDKRIPVKIAKGFNFPPGIKLEGV